MLELILCSTLTILPDYLFRRFGQGKRFGKELTLFSVWFELRWGLTACVMLTIGLITTVFYNHPATTNVTAFFRTVPILPETSGRVSQVLIGNRDEVAKGQPIFKLDSTTQLASLEAAKRKITEVDASMVVARSDLAGAEAKIQQSESAYKQALEELQTKEELNRRGADIVARREIERLQNVVEGTKAGIAASVAAKEGTSAKLSTLLPAEKASAEAARQQAQVELDKMTVYAGFTGKVEQFALRVGDIVNPFMRPAGILIPSEAGRGRLQAGFGQIEAQIMKVGMTAEVTCVSVPFKVIPMVVTGIQDFIAAGQFRGGDTLVDAQQVTRPGTILVYLEPLYEGGVDDVPPGSSCIANAYTSNHDKLADKNLSSINRVTLHVVDAVGLVHAMILRIQALLLPIKVLVFSDH